MAKIVKEAHPVQRSVKSRDDAVAFFRGMPGKVNPTQCEAMTMGGKAGPMTETTLAQHLADAAPVSLRRTRLARVLGITVADAEVERILRALGMNTQQPIGSYDFETQFQSNGNWAFQNGRTKLSRDGSVLMSTVLNGVRYVQMYAPLAALPITANTGASPVSIPLKGSIGNNGALSYSVAVPATKGSVVINGANATYTPPANYNGTDTFTYRVTYGLATRDAVVTVNVAGLNRAPVAVNDTAQTSGGAIVIPVLANDSDPDGNAITIVSVTQPKKANVTNLNNKLRFAPTKGWTGPSTFSYTIKDSKGATATATVTVTKSSGD